MKKELLSAVFGALVSIGIFLLGYFFLDPIHISKFLPESRLETIIYFPMLLVGPLSAILFHELGHLITGLLVGHKLKLFIVAFLGIRENEGRLEIFFNKNLAYFGGIVVTIPKSIKDIDHKSFSHVLLAGPIASLFYGLLCLAIFLYTDHLFNSFFALASLTSFGILIATTVPDKSGLMFTDRKRYQRLNTKGPIQDAEIAMYQLITQSIIENSFKNVDLSKTHILEKDEDPNMHFWAALIRFEHARENNRVDHAESAKKDLYQYKNTIPVNLWRSLKID